MEPTWWEGGLASNWPEHWVRSTGIPHTHLSPIKQTGSGGKKHGVLGDKLGTAGTTFHSFYTQGHPPGVRKF